MEIAAMVVAGSIFILVVYGVMYFTGIGPIISSALVIVVCAASIVAVIVVIDINSGNKGNAKAAWVTK